MTFLVTGGRGAVAQRLISLLDDHGIAYRTASKQPQDAPPGAVHLDLADPETFPAALAGVDSVFLYADSSHIDAFVAEAVAAGVEHIVLLSSAAVLAPENAPNVLADSHRTVEQALLASPIRATLLRPGAFAANAQAWAWPVKAGQPVELPFPGAYTEPIHEADIAEAAFAALTRPELAGQAYELTGPESITMAAQLDIIARTTGRDVAVKQITRGEWKDAMSRYMSAEYADALLDLWAASDGVPAEPTDAVAALTGHPARSFSAWVEDHAAEFAA